MPDGNNYTIEPVDDPFIDDGGGGGDDDTGGDSGSDVDDGGSPGANDSRMSEPVEPITRPPTDDINDGGETGANDSLQSEPPSNDGGDVSFSTGGDDDTGGGTVDDGGQIGVNEDPISKPSQQTDPEPGTAADERLEANRLTEPPGQDAPTNEKVERIVNSRKRLEQARENIRRQAGPASSPKAVQAQPESIVERAPERFFSPDQQVDRSLDFSEEAVVAGQGIIKDSTQFAENTVPETPTAGRTDRFTQTARTVTGIEELLQGDNKQAAAAVNPFVETDAEQENIRTLETGVVQGPGTLAGFTLGSSGAVTSSVEADIKNGLGAENTGPGSLEAITGGSQRLADQASDDPGQFVLEETGEEIGEAVATGGIGLLTPTVTPEITPSTTVQTPETLQQGTRFLTGDLGTRARDTTLVGENEPAVIRSENVELESGGRRQEIRGFNEQGQPVLAGERTETPVTRREILSETLRGSRETVDFLDTPSVGLGPGALVPRETTPETTPDTRPEPGVDFDTETVFDSTKDPGRPLPESFEAPTTRTGVAADTFEEFGQSPGQRNTQQQRQQEPPFDREIFRQPPISEVGQSNVNTLTGAVETRQRTFNRRALPEIFGRQTMTQTGTPTPRREGENRGRTRNVFGATTVEREPRATPSLDAVLTGTTTSEEVPDETVFTGFETRPVEKDERDDIFEGLF